KEIDPLKPAQGLYPLEDLAAATYARDRQVMVTLSIFASAAIFLAVLGIYGVLSQRVRERSREIGIRMALGANTPIVIRWVAGSGLRLIALGLAGGAIAARRAQRRARRSALRRRRHGRSHHARGGRDTCKCWSDRDLGPRMASDADR